MLDRRPPTEDDVTDEEDDRSIDPELRLRTVRTAASTLAESAAVEQRAERRKTLNLHKTKKKGSLFRRGTAKKRPTQDSVASAGPIIPGQRRTIYVNRPLPMSEVDSKNEPLVRYPRNKVRTTSELSCLGVTFTPRISRASRIYRLHVYTKELVRTVSSGSEYLFLGAGYPSRCVTLDADYSETLPAHELTRPKCFPCSARPLHKLRHSPSSLLSPSPLLRTGSKIIVAPKSMRRLIHPPRLNWEIGRTSTAKRTPVNGTKNSWALTRRGK